MSKYKVKINLRKIENTKIKNNNNKFVRKNNKHKKWIKTADNNRNISNETAEN